MKPIDSIVPPKKFGGDWTVNNDTNLKDYLNKPWWKRILGK